MQTMNSATVPARSTPRRHHQAPLQQWDAAAPWRASLLPGENLLQVIARVRRERGYFGPIALTI